MPRLKHYLEQDLDDTARLILLDHREYIDLMKFAAEMQKVHPGVGRFMIDYQWRKWHGDENHKPTHDYVYGHKFPVEFIGVKNG